MRGSKASRANRVERCSGEARSAADVAATEATSRLEATAATGTPAPARTGMDENTSSLEVGALPETWAPAAADVDATTSSLEVRAAPEVKASAAADVDETTSSLEVMASRLEESASRYIPVDVRREVFERDEGCCAFVGVDGRRCRSTYQLQFHHKVPFACGGSATCENLVLYCARHNRHQACQDFGAAHMERFITAPAG